MAEYKSKTVTVSVPPMALYGRLTNLDGILAAVPKERSDSISVEGDSIRLEHSGFSIVIKITEKLPFSKVVYKGVETPFPFTITFLLDNGEFLNQTSLAIVVDAELNFMMKTLLGGKIQEFLDKAAIAISTGQMLG